MHLLSTSIIKITVKKIAISSEYFVFFQWDLQNWKDHFFNLTIGMEDITQLPKSNFEQSKCKWRHQCNAFAKKGTFFWTCPIRRKIVFKVQLGLKHDDSLLNVGKKIFFFSGLNFFCHRFEGNQHIFFLATQPLQRRVEVASVLVLKSMCPFTSEKCRFIPRIVLSFSRIVFLFSGIALCSPEVPFYFSKNPYCFPELLLSFPEVLSFYLLCTPFSKYNFFSSWL